LARTREPERPDASGEAAPLPQPRKYLARFYVGRRLPSPMGGFLEPLRVRTAEDGSGTAFFECSASSLRYQLAVPGATRTERAQVKAQQTEGEDPTCPRHGPEQRLQRSRHGLVCPACGVSYGTPT
jgi:hypothetical protein